MTFSDSSLPPVLPEDAAPLVATVAGSVLLPGDSGYDDERAVWNLNHELVPAVIVVPESVADVQAAVTFAAGQHRPVLVKTTGHQIVGQAHGAVVIATHRMNDVAIDAVGRTARVGAGAIWSEVVEEAAKAGLAPLNGSNPTVGVVGYTLGGGLSPTLGRSHGYAADHVRSLDVVTADGEVRHVDAESEPRLFWALRGGKGNFGVVTALEFDLFPVPRLYGGAIYFPGERAADVLRAWTAWHPSTPETMVTSIAVMRMPAMPAVPEPLRGKFLVSVRIAYTGTPADGERMVEPLWAIAPAVLDTVRDMPYAEVASIHNEPTDPMPYYERGIMLREFPAQAQDKLIELVGPDAETDLVLAELRALGGAWDREPAVPNAVATRSLPYSLLGVSAGPLSQEQQLKRSVAELLDGMKPWQGDRRYVNNLAPDEAADAAAIYGPERYKRLASIKKTYDPANMFRLNHNVMPAAGLDTGGPGAAGRDQLVDHVRHHRSRIEPMLAGVAADPLQPGRTVNALHHAGPRLGYGLKADETARQPAVASGSNNRGGAERLPASINANRVAGTRRSIKTRGSNRRSGQQAGYPHGS